MKTIAENANDFQPIRTMDKGNCIYVDKTDYFHRLVTAPGKNLFFIARPRRFGKSLMITTFILHLRYKVCSHPEATKRGL